MTPAQLDSAFATGAAQALGQIDQANTTKALTQYGQAKTANPSAPDSTATATAQNAVFVQVVDTYMAQQGQYFTPGTTGYTAEEQKMLADPTGLARAENQVATPPPGTLPPGLKSSDVTALAQGGEMTAAKTLLSQQTSQALTAYGQATSNAPGALSVTAATANLQSATFNEEVMDYEQSQGDLYAAPGSAKWQADALTMLSNSGALHVARDSVAQKHAPELSANGLDMAHFGAQLWAGEAVAGARIKQQQGSAPPPTSAKGSPPSTLTLQQQGEQDAVTSLSASMNGLPTSGVDPTLARQALLGSSYVSTLTGQINQSMQAIPGNNGQSAADAINFLCQITSTPGIDPELAALIVGATMTSTSTAPSTLQADLNSLSSEGTTQATQAFVSVEHIYYVLQNAQQDGAPGAAALVQQLGVWSYEAANATDSTEKTRTVGTSNLDHLLPAILIDSQKQHVPANLLHVWEGLSQGHGAPAAANVNYTHDNVKAWANFQSSLDGNKALAATPLAAKVSFNAAATPLTPDQVHTDYDKALSLTDTAAANGDLPAGVDPTVAAATQIMMEDGYVAADAPALARAMIAGKQQELDAAWQQQHVGAKVIMPVDYLTWQASTYVSGLGMFTPGTVRHALRGMEASLPTGASSSAIAATNSAYQKLRSAEATGNATAIASAQQAVNEALVNELNSVYPGQFSGDELLTDDENSDWLYLAQSQVMSDHQNDSSMAAALPALIEASEIIQQSLVAGNDQQSILQIDDDLTGLESSLGANNPVTQAVLNDARVQNLIAAQVSAAISGADPSKPRATLAQEAGILAPYEEKDPAGPVAQQIITDVLGSSATQQILTNAKTAASAKGADPLSIAAPLIQAAQISPTLTLAIYDDFNLPIPSTAPAGTAPSNQLTDAAGNIHSSSDYRDLAIIYAALPDNPQTVGLSSQVAQAQSAKSALITAFSTELGRPNNAATTNLKAWIQASFGGSSSALAWLPQDLITGYQYSNNGKTVTAGKLTSSSLISTINSALYQPAANNSGPSGLQGPSTEMATAASADGSTLQEFSSDDTLAAYVMQAYGLPPAAGSSATGPYDPNTVVYGHTTLGQIISNIKQQAGVTTLSADSSIALQATPVMLYGQLTSAFRVQQKDGSTVWVGPDGSVNQGWAAQDTALTQNLPGTVVQVVGGIADTDANGDANPLLKIDTPPPPPAKSHPFWETALVDAAAVTAGLICTATGDPMLGIGLAFMIYQAGDAATGDGKETVLKFGTDLVEGKASWKEAEEFTVDSGGELLSSVANVVAPGAATAVLAKMGLTVVADTGTAVATDALTTAATKTATTAATDTATTVATDTATTAATGTPTAVATDSATTVGTDAAATATRRAAPTLTRRILGTATAATAMQGVQGVTGLGVAAADESPWNGRRDPNKGFSVSALRQDAEEQSLDLAFSFVTGGISGFIPANLVGQLVDGYGTGVAQSQLNNEVFDHHGVTAEDWVNDAIMAVPGTLQHYVERPGGEAILQSALGHPGSPGNGDGPESSAQTNVPVTTDPAAASTDGTLPVPPTGDPTPSVPAGSGAGDGDGTAVTLTGSAPDPASSLFLANLSATDFANHIDAMTPDELEQYTPEADFITGFYEHLFLGRSDTPSPDEARFQTTADFMRSAFDNDDIEALDAILDKAEYVTDQVGSEESFADQSFSDDQLAAPTEYLEPETQRMLQTALANWNDSKGQGVTADPGTFPRWQMPVTRLSLNFPRTMDLDDANHRLTLEADQIPGPDPAIPLVLERSIDAVGVRTNRDPDNRDMSIIERPHPSGGRPERLSRDPGLGRRTALTRIRDAAHFPSVWVKTAMTAAAGVVAGFDPTLAHVVLTQGLDLAHYLGGQLVYNDEMDWMSRAIALTWQVARGHRDQHLGGELIGRVEAGTASNLDWLKLEKAVRNYVPANFDPSRPWEREALATALDAIGVYREWVSDENQGVARAFSPQTERLIATSRLLNALSGLPGIDSYDLKEIGQALFDRTKYTKNALLIHLLNGFTKTANVAHSLEFFTIPTDMAQWNDAWHVVTTGKGGVMRWLASLGFFPDNTVYILALGPDVFDSAKNTLVTGDRALSWYMPKYGEASASSRARISDINQKPLLRKSIYWSHTIAAIAWIPGDFGWTLTELNNPVQAAADLWSSIYCVVGANYWLPKAGATPNSDRPFGVFGFQNLPGLRWTTDDWGSSKIINVTIAGKTVRVPLADAVAVEVAFGPPIGVTDGIAKGMLNVYPRIGQILLPIYHAAQTPLGRH
jgi:hypothetical protein